MILNENKIGQEARLCVILFSSVIPPSLLSHVHPPIITEFCPSFLSSSLFLLLAQSRINGEIASRKWRFFLMSYYIYQDWTPCLTNSISCEEIPCHYSAKVSWTKNVSCKEVEWPVLGQWQLIHIRCLRIRHAVQIYSFIYWTVWLIIPLPEFVTNEHNDQLPLYSLIWV